jgi:hypothetical protein
MNGSGLRYLDADTSLLVGPFPAAILAVLVVALAMLAAAAMLTARADF